MTPLQVFAILGWCGALGATLIALRFRRERDAARRTALELPAAARDAVARWREKAKAARERNAPLRHPPAA